MVFDSHVHFDTARGEQGIEETIRRAMAAGVTRLLAVGGTPVLNRHAITAARRFPRVVQASLGWDRDQATSSRWLNDNHDQHALQRHWQRRIAHCRAIGAQIVAVGEIGLDYHYSADTAEAQCRLMRRQLEIAAALHLPVIVHSRAADADTLLLLKEHQAVCRNQSASSSDALGVVHCFTGSLEFARQLLDLNFMLGFSGIVTFRNADALREVARFVPDNRLLLETDTPYLAPVPHRGRRNEPALLPAILECLSEVRRTTTDQLARVTSHNAISLFGG